ncbi:MarR family transcriptional regulator [Yinghuangia aomiensis]
MVRKQTDRMAAAAPTDDPAVAGIEAFITQVTAMSRLPASRRRLRRLAQIDTHESGIGILMLLSRTGPLSVTDLARHLGVNQSTASRQVAPLEEDGYLTRTVHPSHRRIQLLALSETGAAACERAHAVGRRDIRLGDQGLARRRPHPAERTARTLHRHVGGGGDRPGADAGADAGGPPEGRGVGGGVAPGPVPAGTRNAPQRQPLLRARTPRRRVVPRPEPGAAGRFSEPPIREPARSARRGGAATLDA